jgi:hypothetical protein
MKEITMPYSEYTDMQDKIKEQQEFIEQVKKRKGVVLLDCRKIGNRCNNFITVPYVVGDSEVAKEFLQAEFAQLEKQVEAYFNRHSPHPTNKKSWWEKVFN